MAQILPSLPRLTGRATINRSLGLGGQAYVPEQRLIGAFLCGGSRAYAAVRGTCLQRSGNSKPSPKGPLTQRLEATKERTKELTTKVTSSLSALTPHENIYNIPNILTASRLIAAPVIGYLVLHDQYGWALALFAYAGITDLVDGWMARRWKLQTVVGSVIDPMADKVLMTVLTVALAVKGALP
ncbi:hypothetical protein LTR28_005287, partial [Elasticomyces elasticus]